MSYFLIFPQIWAKIDHNMCEKILDQVQLAIKSHNSDIETLKVQMKSLQEENIELKGEVISLKIDIITLKVDKSEKNILFPSCHYKIKRKGTGQGNLSRSTAGYQLNLW